MTNSELTDNITFLAAEQMLKCLVESDALTEEEARSVRKELNRRLCPTVVFSLRSYTDVIKENV